MRDDDTPFPPSEIDAAEPATPPKPPGPPPKRRGRPPGGRTRSDYFRFGPPPEDTLHANDYVHRALMVAFSHVLMDPRLKERDRRKEMRDIARSIALITPRSRLLEAEELVKKDIASLEQENTGPEMEDATRLDRQSHRATATRGRPRR
jgi:hypothetical protein